MEVAEELELEFQSSYAELFIKDYSPRDIKKAAANFQKIFGESAHYILVFLMREFIKKGKIKVSLLKYKRELGDIDVSRFSVNDSDDGNTFRMNPKGNTKLEIEVTVAGEEIRAD